MCWKSFDSVGDSVWQETIEIRLDFGSKAQDFFLQVVGHFCFSFVSHVELKIAHLVEVHGGLKDVIVQFVVRHLKWFLQILKQYKMYRLFRDSTEWIMKCSRYLTKIKSKPTTTPNFASFVQRYIG